VIVLVQPMYSKRELNADSNYVIYSSLIRGFHEAGLPHHFVVVFPDDKSGFAYSPDGFFSLPNVTRVPQRISTRKMVNAVTFDGTWYTTLLRRFGFDLVWCNLVEVAAQIKHSSDSTFEDAGRPAVIVAHNYAIHRSLPYPMHAMEHVLWAQFVGAVNADVNVFNSDHCKFMLLEEARDRLSEESCKKIEDSSVRIDYGPLEADLPMVQHKVDLPIIAYNHRLQGYKQWRTTFDVLKDLWDEGVRFRVRYMNNTTENSSAIRAMPFVEVRLCKDRRDYLEALSGCHLNVMNSLHETFCISAIESMAHGQPLIAPDGVTFPQITGKTAGNRYPYLFRDVDQQKVMLRKLLASPLERRRLGGVVRKHVNENYTRSLWVERYADLFEQASARHQPSTDKKFVAKVGDLLTSYPRRGKKARAFYNDLTRMRVNGRQKVSNQSFPMAKVIRLARQAGGEILFAEGEQFVRSGR